MNEDLFEVVSGADAGTRLGLAGEEAVLGRDPASDLTISDPRVSRRHARVWREGEALMIQDLGSTGGTSVNGSFITTPTALAAGDQVRVGLTELRVVWSPALAATMFGPVIPPPQEAPPPPSAAETPPPPPAPAMAPPAALVEIQPPPAVPVEIQPPPLDLDDDHLADPGVAALVVSPVPEPPPPPQLAPEDDAYATFHRPAIVVPEPVAAPADAVAPVEPDGEDEYVDVEIGLPPPPPPPSAVPPVAVPHASAPPVPEPAADVTSLRPAVAPESPPPAAVEAPAPPPAPDPEAGARRERNVRAAKEIADAAMMSQAGRTPGWLYRIMSMLRR